MDLREGFPKLDKTLYWVDTIGDDAGDREYWRSCTPEERLAALELYRRINYGYNPLTDRVQRVLEFAEREPG